MIGPRPDPAVSAVLIRTTSADANRNTHFLFDPHQSREQTLSFWKNTQGRQDDTDSAELDVLREKKK